MMKKIIGLTASLPIGKTDEIAVIRVNNITMTSSSLVDLILILGLDLALPLKL
jgi:hypothetical protein